MPQRPTTHKVLHKAVIGSVFVCLCTLLVQSLPCAWGQSSTAVPSPAASTRSGAPRLVKNDSVKSTAAASLASPVAKGKLREIPLSTLEGRPPEPVAKEAKPVSTPSSAPKKVESATQKNKATESKDVAKETAKVEDSAKSAGKAAVKTTVKTVKTVTTTTSKKAAKPAARLNNGLVPPPPPIMPIGMDALGMYGAPVDYLSMKELEGRKKELTARFNELDSTVKDGERQINERKERANLFESLYQEGVVSRKELEVAKREAGDIDRDLKFKQDELESVKLSMKAVNNRLDALKKQESRNKKAFQPLSVKKAKAKTK